jgi:hypothetical protein
MTGFIRRGNAAKDALQFPQGKAGSDDDGTNNQYFLQGFGWHGELLVGLGMIGSAIF